MKAFLLSLLFVSTLSFSQDTLIYGDLQIKITDSLQPILEVPLPIFVSDCAHGHECCSAGCSCCPELRRPQVYDTLVYSLTDGGSRYEVFERHYFAATHAPSIVQYLFKNKEGQFTHSFYSANSKYRHLDIHAFNKSHSNEKFDTEFDQELVGVFNSKTGYKLINEYGEVQKPKYHSFESLGDNLNRVSLLIGEKRVYGLCDDEENQMSFLNYSQLGELNSDGFLIATDFKRRSILLNSKGEEIENSEFSRIEALGEGLYAIHKSAGWKLFNSKGEQLTSQAYRGIGKLSDGLIRVDSEKKSGFIDKTGKEVIKPKYEWASDFSDGLAGVLRNEKWGFIDKTGDLVIPYKFDRIRNFQNGRAPVAEGEDSNKDIWGLIDKKGIYKSNPKYDELSEFKGNYCKVSVNHQGNGFIDAKGKEVMPAVYFIESYGTKDDWFFNDLTLLRTVGSDGYLLLMNSKGEVVSEYKDLRSARFAYLTNTNIFLPYLLTDDKNDKKGMMDTDGTEMIPSKYDYIYILNKEIALLQKGDSWLLYNFINGTEKELTKAVLTLAPSHEIFKMKNDKEEEFFLNSKGEIVIPY